MILISPTKWHNELNNSRSSEAVTWVSCFLNFLPFDPLVVQCEWQLIFTDKKKVININSWELIPWNKFPWSIWVFGPWTENSTDETNLQFEIKILLESHTKASEFWLFLNGTILVFAQNPIAL